MFHNSADGIESSFYLAFILNAINIVASQVMRGHGLPLDRQKWQQLQFLSHYCSTEGQHLVAVADH